MTGGAGVSFRGLGGLGDLIGIGLRALQRYTGTLFAVFVVQSLVAAACFAGVAIVLATAFWRLPMFDRAVDGDIAAWVWCLRHAPSTFLAAGGVVAASLILWQLVTWFLAGGLYGVLATRPESRVETARRFGAAGAATYLAYARLALCAVPGYVLVLVVLGISLDAAVPRIEYALTVADLAGAVVVGFVPPLIVLHVAWTIVDYARIEIALHHEKHRPGALGAYLRAASFVVRRPLTLVHGALGWLFWVMVTLAYAYLAQGHPMYGAGGAITLFFVRQVVSLARLAVRIAAMAGQVEMSRTRPAPPARAVADADA